MSENNTDGQRTWLIVLPIIFILFVAVVFLGFVNAEGLTTEQRIDYCIKALTTTGTIFAGIAVFINAFYAAKTSAAMNKNADAALKNAVIAEDKQITERFAKAIEQLGSEKIEVRLGAIYTLERIAKDSPKDHWTIMEVLTAFVRENAPRKLEEENTENTEQIPKIRTDIQAALTVIGRRNFENDKENQRLDLSNIDIRGANLEEAALQRANLTQANLQQANLTQAKLQQANLMLANLQQAHLSVENILLDEFGANLTEANLHLTNLENAFLYRANLHRASLYEANIKSAGLSWANLQGADLTKVKNLEQGQIDSAKGDRTTKLPDHLKYPEHWQ